GRATRMHQLRKALIATRLLRSSASNNSLHRLPQTLRAKDFSLRPILQALSREPRRIRHLKRHEVAAVDLLFAPRKLLLQPARDLRAEGHGRRDGLVGAKHFTCTRNGLEVRPWRELRHEDLRLEQT